MDPFVVEVTTASPSTAAPASALSGRVSRARHTVAWADSCSSLVGSSCNVMLHTFKESHEVVNIPPLLAVKESDSKLYLG
jgi:hypothetical protein